MKDKKKDERKDSTLKFVHDTLRIRVLKMSSAINLINEIIEFTCNYFYESRMLRRKIRRKICCQLEDSKCYFRFSNSHHNLKKRRLLNAYKSINLCNYFYESRMREKQYTATIRTRLLNLFL